MEHTIRAPLRRHGAEGCSSTVGDQVDSGAVLVVVEPRGRRPNDRRRSDTTGWDRVAWITIDRPEARNALNRAVRDGLCVASPQVQRRRRGGAGPHRHRRHRVLRWRRPQGDVRRRLEVPPPDFVPVFGRTLDGRQADDRGGERRRLRRRASCSPRCATCASPRTTRASRSPRCKVGRGAPWAAPLPWLIPPRVAMELLVTAEPLPPRAPTRSGS